MSEFFLPAGDAAEQSQRALIIRFCGGRKVLSTSALNGGLRTDLNAVYNYNACKYAGICEEMQGRTLKEHCQNVALRLGLSPDSAAGLTTAASIDNLSAVTLRHEDFSVTALVTAGIDGNAGRVGSPASLQEKNGEPFAPPGTINVILAVDAGMSDGAMAEALAVCTEAKTAVLQELAAPSCGGRGLATGTGTDGTIIISRTDTPEVFYNAGQHFKLGELIGKAVMRGVREALFRQCGICGASQHSVLRRMERFGVTRQAVKDRFICLAGERPVQLDRWIDRMDRDGYAAACAALYARLIDEQDWRLLPASEAARLADGLLSMLFSHYGCDYGGHVENAVEGEEAFCALRDAFLEGAARLLKIHMEGEREENLKAGI